MRGKLQWYMCDFEVYSVLVQYTTAPSLGLVTKVPYFRAYVYLCVMR